MWLWRGREASIDAVVYAGGVEIIARSSTGQSASREYDPRGERDRYRFRLPRTVRGDYLSIEVIGDIDLYQVSLEVD
jgi:hypothetical protein